LLLKTHPQQHFDLMVREGGNAGKVAVAKGHRGGRNSTVPHHLFTYGQVDVLSDEMRNVLEGARLTSDDFAAQVRQRARVCNGGEDPFRDITHEQLK